MTGTTKNRLDTIRDVPLALPQAQLRRGDSIVVSSFKLALGQKLSLGWLGLQLLKLSPGTPQRVNSSLGIIYAGIYAGGFDTLRRPSGTPLQLLSISSPTMKILNPYTHREFSGPDIIEVLVVNNTTNIDVEVMLVGASKFYLAG